MPVDLRVLVDPAHTAVVTQELQGGVVGAESLLPALADAAAPVIPAVHRLVVAARAAGVPVVHCLAATAQPTARVQRERAALQGGAEVAGEAAARDRLPPAWCRGSTSEDTDLVLTRLHGLGPMAGTDLDPVLRNLGVTTIVGVGVSVNVGMTNFVMDGGQRRLPVRAAPRRRGRRAQRLRRRRHRQHPLPARDRHHGRRGRSRAWDRPA